MSCEHIPALPTSAITRVLTEPAHSAAAILDRGVGRGGTACRLPSAPVFSDGTGISLSPGKGRIGVGAWVSSQTSFGGRSVGCSVGTGYAVVT